MFHHQIEHLEVRQKYSAARNIFNSLLGGSSVGETLGLILDILEKSESHNLRGGGGGGGGKKRGGGGGGGGGGAKKKAGVGGAGKN